MSDPSDVKDILQDLLTMGLIRIRALAWEGNADRCAIEADHIHNLPRLLAHEEADGLVYYWEAERPSYIRQSEPTHLAMWEPLWRRLQAHIGAVATAQASR